MVVINTVILSANMLLTASQCVYCIGAKKAMTNVSHKQVSSAFGIIFNKKLFMVVINTVTLSPNMFVTASQYVHCFKVLKKQ